MRNPYVGFIGYDRLGMPLVSLDRVILVHKRAEDAQSMVVNGQSPSGVFPWQVSDVLAFTDAGFAVLFTAYDEPLIPHFAKVYERVKMFTMSRLNLEPFTQASYVLDGVRCWRPVINPRTKPRALTFEWLIRIASASYVYNRLTMTRAKNVMKWLGFTLEREWDFNEHNPLTNTGFVNSLNRTFGQKRVTSALVDAVRGFCAMAAETYYAALDASQLATAPAMPEPATPSDHGIKEVTERRRENHVHDHGDGTLSVCA